MLKYQQVSFIELNNNPRPFVRIEITEDGVSSFSAIAHQNFRQLDGAQCSGMSSAKDALDFMVKYLKNSANVTLFPDVFLMVSHGMLVPQDVSDVLSSNSIVWNNKVHEV
ncbi:hypothetical protein [Citrobacter freundii]|uniref:hypothetical protein n=1 Tax=Citrobacter freundii TaxID=546 RepID=UPI0028BD2A20|nr:hypothetical protein [Citrobacter freundii]MDT7444866.1 hypothetical protein [Citrobacter freundii]MDT7444985.1 hypothetical protein [Citrobacter freundii]MDT7449235.1 hypothetical protein [Citrobacter freundii]